MTNPVELDGKFNSATGCYECSPATPKEGEREINIVIMGSDPTFPEKILITREWQKKLDELGGWAL